MSHEIRTPLNSIVGFSQVLQSKIKNLNLPGEFSQFLDHIITGGKNLSELINDILDLSKIVSGKMTVTEELLNLHVLIETVYNINKSLADRKRLDFYFYLDPELPTNIKSDGNRLNQILMNLLSNAIKFSPKNKTVSLTVQKDGSDIVFDVTDQGIGIPEDRLDSVFSEFEQVDGSSTRDQGGTGLGLAIVKKIINLMNGSISVTSVLGEGTTFIARIPFDEAVKPVSIVDKEVPQTHLNPDSVILVAEDDLINQKMITALFKDLDMPIHLVGNGLEAVEKAAELKPDLIIMDIHMPQMDGIEATRLIKQTKESSQIPIIALSADAFVEQKRAAMTVGFVDYLTKPLDYGDFMRVLTKYLSIEQEGNHSNTVEKLNHGIGGTDPVSSTVQPDLERLPELFAFLKKKSDVCTLLCKTLPLEQIQTFSEQMMKAGEEFRYSPLIHWGELINAQVRQFRFDLLPQTLNQYSELQEKLKIELKNRL